MTRAPTGERAGSSSRAERISELQARVDEAEGRLPVPRGVPHLVVGSWLALVAHYLLTGGVPVDSPRTVLFGLLAAAGWGFLLVGGARFARARARLRRLRRELAALLQRESGLEPPEGPGRSDPS